jgi:pSer/pThr/pTyr-binding forkhead associated (FHA) protein
MSPEVLLLILRVAIAVILYGFLVVILVHLWRDLQSSKRSTLVAPEAHLEKLEGEGVEHNYPLDEINLIGRAKDNTVILDESTVSGYHSRLSYQQEQWWLEDLGSRNGTFLNDLPVTEPLVITYGDELGFGNVRMRIVSGKAPEESYTVKKDPPEE